MTLETTQEFRDGDFYIIPRGTVLYRAADTIEKAPIPRLCPDTRKTGVYFAFNHPWISECMTIEYKKDLPICVYFTTDDLNIRHGKYSESQRNEAHFDTGISPVHLHSEDYHPDCVTGELFLTNSELPFVEYAGVYHMSTIDAMNKWVPDFM